MGMKNIALLMLISLCLLSACKEEKQAEKIPADASAEAVVDQDKPEITFEQVDVSAWIGTWVGVEGTSLNIAQRGAGYAVTITNLDGPRTFDGQADGGVISFNRDGAEHILQPGTGADTGMKWLADKRNCLVVVGANEGYCRD